MIRPSKDIDLHRTVKSRRTHHVREVHVDRHTVWIHRIVAELTMYMEMRTAGKAAVAKLPDLGSCYHSGAEQACRHRSSLEMTKVGP